MLTEHPFRTCLSAWARGAQAALNDLPDTPEGAWAKAPRAALEDDLAGFAPNDATARQATAGLLGHTPALANLARFADLDDVEITLFAFIALADALPGLLTFLTSLHAATPTERAAVLARVLGLQPGEVEAALAPDAHLRRRGLVHIEWGRETPWLAVRAADATRVAPPDSWPPESVLGVCSPLSAPLPEAVDFGHLAASRDTLHRMLEVARKDGQRAQVAVHGAPRSGRTQFVRSTLSATGADTWQIDGAAEVAVRLWETATRWSAERPDRVFVVDFSGARGSECEELGAALAKVSASGTRHAPTVWVLDTPDVKHTSLIDRFALTLEVHEPPLGVRRGLIARWLAEGGPVDADHFSAAVPLAKVPLATAARAVSVARRLAPEPAAVGDWALRVACSKDSMATGMTPSLPFEPSYANVELPEGLGLDDLALRCQRGRLCFYGPPGTGKSAMARALAERTGRPTLVRRGSDLFGPWVGDTEKALAAAFREASDSGATLIFDEVDGLLMDRRRSERNFEVRQVNEFLQQVDDFRGLLVCTTNRLEGLDPASLRRFDLKVEFRPLRPCQRRDLLAAVLSWHGQPAPDGVAYERVAGLDGLVPGDFDVAARRSDLLGRPLTTETLLETLAAEVALRRRDRPVGFVPPGVRTMAGGELNALKSPQ